MRGRADSGIDKVLALLDFAPWTCWAQGHGWLRCLRNPVHRYRCDR